MKIQNISQDLLKRIEDNGGEISEENVTEENLDLNENITGIKVTKNSVG
jgi:hypothetical protein